MGPCTAGTLGLKGADLVGTTTGEVGGEGEKPARRAIYGRS